MRNTVRNGSMIAFVLTLLTAAVVGVAGPADADDCLALGGNPAFLPGECRIDAVKTASDAAHGGPFTISEPLRVTGAGSIIVPAKPGGNALTLNVAGDLTMDLPTAAGGGRISGDVTTASGIGATLSIEVTGNIVVHGSGAAGAKITSNQTAGSCSGGRGGNISLSANGSIITEAGSVITSTSICGQGEIIIVADVSITLKGVVSSDSAFGRGGPVSVTAGCTLTVAATGRVTSQGKDPGADLVHLQGGCDVLIQGKVESTGPGHARPPANRCHPPDRPELANAPACVEVWSGGTLTVDSTLALKGEINADSAQSGGANCCAWIDLFALKDVQIKGDTTGVFAVHANQFLNTAFGGIIRVKSKDGNVTASGLAIQANATQAGGTGGIVTIEAKGDVTLDEAQILAKGDAVAAGGFGTGGTVGARAFSGILSWVNASGGVVATGDVQPTGTGIPAAQSGVIFLTSCLGNPINTSKTLFPVTLGTFTSPVPATNMCSQAAPELPGHVFLPDCVCAEEGTPDASVVKTATKPIVNAGEIASYTITVTAGGSANSTNVKLTDVVPSGFTWTVGGANAQSCSPASPPPLAGGTTLTCSFGTMPPGTSKSITLSTQTSTSNANCPIGVTITNAATVTYDNDPDTSNNSSGPVTIAVKCPDVSVVKSTTTPTITAGASATYNVVVTAGASSSSTNVVLTDLLPAGLTWTVSGATASTDCTPFPTVTGGNTLTCTFGTMAPNATRTITLTATTSTTNCPAINNTASVSSDGDTNPGNNTAGPVKITVNCAADVKVVKTATDPTINAGEQAAYTVQVTALGPASSTHVVLTDILPSGLNWTVGGLDAGLCSPLAGGNTLSCAFGTMAKDAVKTITLTATTSTANCPAINNTATVNADSDTTASNNSSGPVKITVNCPDVKVVKSTTTPTISAGGTAKYSITVTANGPGSSSDVVLTEPLPAGLTWTVSGATASTDCTPFPTVTGGSTLTCNFGTLAQGDTRTITLSGATVLIWNFKGPNKVLGTSAGADFSAGSTTIHLDAFVGSTSTSNGSAVFVYGKDQGAGEQGAGICVSATGSPLACNDTHTAHEIDSNEDGTSANDHGLIRINLGSNLASLTNFSLVISSVQSGENFKILTNSANTVNGATLLHSGTSADDDIPIPLSGVKQYVFVQGGTAGDVLLATLTANVCGTISNTATVSSTGDSDASNNSSGPVTITISCACAGTTTLAFTGGSASSGTPGNIRTFTANGVSVKASAFSRTDSNSAWATAYLGLYGAGLGVTNNSESGVSPTHKVDNQGGEHDYVLFEFSLPVVIDQLFLDSIGADSDMSVWIGTKADPFNNHITLSDAVLTSLGAREDNNTSSTATSRTADINAGAVSGNVVVIAASTSDTSPEDEFKISQLVLTCQ